MLSGAVLGFFGSLLTFYFTQRILSAGPELIIESASYANTTPYPGTDQSELALEFSITNHANILSGRVADVIPKAITDNSEHPVKLKIRDTKSSTIEPGETIQFTVRSHLVALNADNRLRTYGWELHFVDDTGAKIETLNGKEIYFCNSTGKKAGDPKIEEFQSKRIREACVEFFGGSTNDYTTLFY